LPKRGNKGEALPKRGKERGLCQRGEIKSRGRVLDFLNQDCGTP